MAALLSYALTTVADVKESLGIASSDTSKDNLIIRKINQATVAIEKYCERRFAETTYTNVYYNGTDIDQIVLRQRPVTSVVVLGARNTSLNEDSFETLDDNLYFLNSAAGILNLNFNAAGRWSAYQVTYTAGYASIPADLGEACASLAAYYVTNASGFAVGVMEKQEGQRALRYSNNTTLSFENIVNQLGINGIIKSYANYPFSNL